MRCGPYLDLVERHEIKLMGAAEIQKRLGFSRQWTGQIINRRTFPAPIAELALGQIWLAQDVEEWIATNRPDIDEADEA